jgi:ketosteroid isomerase-like protein
MPNEQMVRSAFEKVLIGDSTEYVALLDENYVIYAADPCGGYKEYAPGEYTKVFARAASLTDATYTVLDSFSVGEEIVGIVVLTTRSAKKSGLAVEYRVVTLVHIVEGKIRRMTDMTEQSAFDFWRSAWSD